MIPNNPLKFHYFCDFNKCLRAIFSQLSYENFWLHIFWVRLSWLKIIKSYYKSPPKVCELNQIYSKILRQFSKGSLISVSLEPSKIRILIKVLYWSFWLTFADFLFHALDVSFCY